ncbi:hypothetical protein C8Q79DRAFT_416902 [Trametes meyenii]|nr:hypothetical protein C8Q79DRAFT_416902 [Trametes meyenii]
MGPSGTCHFRNTPAPGGYWPRRYAPSLPSSPAIDRSPPRLVPRVDKCNRRMQCTRIVYVYARHDVLRSGCTAVLRHLACAVMVVMPWVPMTDGAGPGHGKYGPRWTFDLGLRGPAAGPEAFVCAAASLGPGNWDDGPTRTKLEASALRLTQQSCGGFGSSPLGAPNHWQTA